MTSSFDDTLTLTVRHDQQLHLTPAQVRSVWCSSCWRCTARTAGSQHTPVSGEGHAGSRPGVHMEGLRG